MSRPKHLQQQMRRLLRCMDFASRHPALDQPGREGRRLAEIYQLLGLAWEMLALQCRHRAGWRKLKDGQQVCKICGTLKDSKARWRLLPNDRPKVIGRMARPTTKRILPNRQAATVVKDEVRFHGVRLSVEVLNSHQSRLFDRRDITIAADRLVELREDNLLLELSDWTIRLRTASHRPGKGLPYSAFLSELPRKTLARFPVMVEYDRRGRFVGIVIFRERKPRSGGKEV